MTTDTTTDLELARLLDIIEQGYYEAGRFVRKGQLGSDGFARAIGAHAALLGHMAARYVRRDDPRYRILDRANERMIGYAAARGILPWRPGDELPEERIRRLRDAADSNEENADVP